MLCYYYQTCTLFSVLYLLVVQFLGYFATLNENCFTIKLPSYLKQSLLQSEPSVVN